MTTGARDTPMMRHFRQIKAQYPDAIVLYRMGDFYELFLADAELAAPLLDLTLTSRDKGKVEPVPMCGFPVHSADGYIKRLAELGHCVAICEQVEDPKAVDGKRLVRREVIEVVSPGLVGDPAGLDGTREVALAALALPRAAGVGAIGIAALDATTGDFRATSVSEQPQDPQATVVRGLLPDLVCEELERIAPREVLVADADLEGLRPLLSRLLPGALLTQVRASSYEPDSVSARPAGWGEIEGGAAGRAAAALLAYLGQNQPFALAQVPRVRAYALGDTMVLDAATRMHLELFENAIDRGRSGTLIEEIDHSVTPLGSRRLGRWLAYPLLDPDAIRTRHTAVAFLASRDRFRRQLRDVLGTVRDLERILAKATRPSAVPRDLGVLRKSLQALPGVARVLALKSETGGAATLLPGSATQPEGASPLALDPPEVLSELQRLLEESLIDDPPVVARGSRGANETGYIRSGFRAELDVLRESAAKGREWIAGLETQERERTGIATLKVRYHPVHGYSLEVTKAQQDRVPSHYERKQTLASVERFTTPELSEMQGKVIGANERAAELERAVFESIRQSVVAEASRIRRAAGRIADLDAFAALAEVARQRSWVQPEIDRGVGLDIRAGRHPIVEEVLRRESLDGFVANDTALDPADVQILLLTGPNMSGKSTYLRQVALIALLAQMGSFVPADSAKIGVVDRIFTRVGASDRLARGESTFMVEMRETAEILRQATRRSLLILDEIGRGTSTFDGLSIAWAVAEYLHDTPAVSARTLFATHYHELTDLARSKPRVHNAHFEAREWKDEVVFLRRLVPGGASRSYGIQVARLAGLPGPVLERAREILRTLEEGELTPDGLPRLAGVSEPARGGQLSLILGDASASPSADPVDDGQRTSAVEREVLDALRALSPDQTTPFDALVTLRRFVLQLQDGEGEAS